MRILHVIPGIAARYGGPSQAVAGMCRALRDRAGIDAEIATTDADGPRGRMAIDGFGPGLHQGIPVWMFPRSFSESWKYSRQLAAWLRHHAADYDVLHVHAVFSHATTAACRAAARRGVPVVLRPCGMLAPYSLRQSRVRKLLYWRLVESYNVRSAHALHATTPAERDELKLLLPGQRVECIPLGLDDEAWMTPKDPGTFRDRFGIPRDRPLVLFLSRLNRKKGLVDFLLPALLQLPKEVMLAVVGDDDPHDPRYAASAREAVSRLGLEKRVVFTGPAYGKDKWAAYDDADVFALPSAHENFGITVVEALARGLPGVVSPGVQAAMLVQASGMVTIAPREPAALAEALRGVLPGGAQYRPGMATHGAQYARAHLSWEAASSALTELYHAAVGRSFAAAR